MVVTLQCNLNCLGHIIIWNDINICKSLGIVFPFKEILQYIGLFFLITVKLALALSTQHLRVHYFYPRIFCVCFYLISTWTSNRFLAWIPLNYINDLILWGGTESLSFISLNVTKADKDGFFLRILHTRIVLYSIRTAIYRHISLLL